MEWTKIGRCLRLLLPCSLSSSIWYLFPSVLWNYSSYKPSLFLQFLKISIFLTILKATLNLGRDDVFKVDVKNSFSFFNTDADLSDLVMSTFTDFQMDGRFINVELSTKGAGRDRGGRKRGNDDGRKHSNDEGRSRKKGQRESRKQKTAEALQQAFKKKKKRK